MPEMIKEYLSTKSQSLIKKFKKNLTVSVNFLAGVGVSLGDTPSEEQYTKLREYWSTQKIKRGKYSGQFYEADYIDDLMKLTREFYEFKKGDMIMPESTEAVNMFKSVEPEQPANLETFGEDTHYGRPAKYREPRKKFTVYLTSEMIDAVKDLARLDGIETAALTFGVFKELIERRHEDIEYIRSRRIRQ